MTLINLFLRLFARVPHHVNVLRARCVFVPCCLRHGILTSGGVDVPTTAAKTHSHKNALDAVVTILYQQCSDMQLDVGQDIVELSCVERFVKLLEFAHTSACVCVSCFCASDAHGFFAECFINCRRSMRTKRVTVDPQEVLQHTSISEEVFVLCALVPAMLLATWWVRPPSMTVGVGNPATEVKEHSRFSRLITHSFTSQLPSSCGHATKSKFFR